MPITSLIAAIEAGHDETQRRIAFLEAAYGDQGERARMLLEPYLDSLRRSAAYAERILEGRQLKRAS